MTRAASSPVAARPTTARTTRTAWTTTRSTTEAGAALSPARTSVTTHTSVAARTAVTSGAARATEALAESPAELIATIVIERTLLSRSVEPGAQATVDQKGLGRARSALG